jgi:hypothetical protein
MFSTQKIILQTTSILKLLISKLADVCALRFAHFTSDALMSDLLLVSTQNAINEANVFCLFPEAEMLVGFPDNNLTNF